MTRSSNKVVDDYRLMLGDAEFVPIMVGGMGVDISTADLALEACRLGGIGHISDAMSPFVGDQKYGSKHTKTKANRHKATKDGFDKSTVKFQTEDLMQAQREVVDATMARKRGDGAVFINIMEKLNMGAPTDTLRARLNAALDGGIDGITLSAGLHTHSMGLMKDNPRFRDAKIGTIVSSVRALKIFLRSAKRVDRMPDYVIVEGPLAGGHLGFGDDWAEYELADIVAEVLQFLRDESLDIVVIPAGGIFTGTDAAEYLEMGAGAVQVATRFTITEEAGLPARAKTDLRRGDRRGGLRFLALPHRLPPADVDLEPVHRRQHQTPVRAFRLHPGRQWRLRLPRRL
jgi:nitronate monooxygenase